MRTAFWNSRFPALLCSWLPRRWAVNRAGLRKPYGVPISVVAAGDVKVDNTKFKSRFAVKAAMLSRENTEAMIGHSVEAFVPSR